MAKKNDTLTKAKSGKNDEFYTQYEDIQREMNAYLEYNTNTFRDKTILLPCDDPEWSNFTRFFAQNFERFGIKKLISTSYATASKNQNSDETYQFTIEDFLTDYEKQSPQYDGNITAERGKIFTLDRDIDDSGTIDLDDLQWTYLDGDGDFRSDEVKTLRNEADVIITNPPFSLFREFLAWVTEANKEFMMIGNINCITYKEVFPLIKSNKAWLGNGMGRWISGFIVPEKYELYGTEARIEQGKRIVATNNCLWFTNIEHGRRHQAISLMTQEDNLRYSSHKTIREKGYRKYDFYDAIEVPYTDAIPSNYEGLMGVPVTFLDKYNPEQFEIMGCSYSYGDPGLPWHKPEDSFNICIDGENVYKRIFIRKKV